MGSTQIDLKRLLREVEVTMPRIIGLQVYVEDCKSLEEAFNYAVRVCVDEKRTVVFYYSLGSNGEEARSYKVEFGSLVEFAISANDADLT